MNNYADGVLAMSFDRRSHSKACRFDWGYGYATLLFNSESSTIASHPSYDGRFCLDLGISDRCRLIHLTTRTVSVGRNLYPPIYERWLKPFSIFGDADFTVMRDGMSSLIDHVPYIPPEACQSICNTIWAEVQDAIQKSIFLEHSTLWMVAKVYVLTNMAYYYDHEEIDWFQQNNSINVIGRGLTEAAIERHIKVEEMDGKTFDETCMVCLDEIGALIGWMPCKHAFHPDCIKKWLERSKMCPLCRFEVQEISE